MANVLGFIGVFLLLSAFFLNLIGLVTIYNRFYVALNLIGASIACYSSYLMKFAPFVILEGTWAIVAAVALIRAMIGGRRSLL